MPGRLNLRIVILRKDSSRNHDECFSLLYSLEGENICVEQSSWSAQETLDKKVLDVQMPPFKIRDQQKMIIHSTYT